MEAPRPTRAWQLAQPPLARCLYSVCLEAPVLPGDGLYSPRRWSTFALGLLFLRCVFLEGFGLGRQGFSV